MFFEYDQGYSYGKRTSVITREQAETIADLFTAKGIESPFRSVSPMRKHDDGRYVMAYEEHPELVEAVADLPSPWDLDVAHILEARRKAKALEELRAAQARVEHAAIRAYLLAQPASQYLRTPEVRDLSEMAKLATRGDLGNGKPVYSPLPGCKARLKLKEAVTFWYEQASYADHTRYAIPVEMEAGADVGVCRANLGRFCSALRTHNGFAGSGCTWTAELIVEPAGAFVVMDCRASISD
jgi:hypothetical protein